MEHATPLERAAAPVRSPAAAYNGFIPSWTGMGTQNPSSRKPPGDGQSHAAFSSAGMFMWFYTNHGTASARPA